MTQNNQTNIIGADSEEKSAKRGRKSAKTIDKEETKMLKPSLNKPSANTPSAKRKPRKPLHQQKRIFFRDSEEGYYYRIVNDKPSRITSFLEAGYEIVEGENQDPLKGTCSSNQMGSTAAFDVGDGMTAYRMRIPRELFEEDNAVRIEESKKIDWEIEGKDEPNQMFKKSNGDSVTKEKNTHYYVRNNHTE